MGIRENLDAIHMRIAAAARRAGRSPEDVTLVAVSKFQPDAAIEEAYQAGQRLFGENYAQELRDKAQRLGKTEVSPADCILIGNEGHGLTDEIISACDSTIYIPMSMGVESLNAAVAASVLLWEFFGRG